jgi:hypothetical protein
VRDQSVQEALHAGAELLRFAAELGQRLGQPVGHLDVAAPQGPQQLVLVVARHAERVAAGDHAHHQPQDPRRVGPAVDQVTEEDRTPPRVMGPDRASLAVPADRVAELAEQPLKLGPAAVHVADHVERPGLVPQVVVQPRPRDPHVGDLVAPQRVDRAEPLALQPLQPAAQLVVLAADDIGAEGPVGTGRIARDAHVLRNIHNDRHREHIVLTGNRDELPARPGLDVGGVHHGQPPRLQPFPDDVVQQLERVRRRGLVVLVVGHQSAAEVRRDHLRRPEVGGPEGGLPGAGHPDQHDQAQLGNCQLTGHEATALPNTAICVGGPVSGSSGPTGRYRTVYP